MVTGRRVSLPYVGLENEQSSLGYRNGKVYSSWGILTSALGSAHEAPTATSTLGSI